MSSNPPGSAAPARTSREPQIAQRVSFALAIFPTEVVHRATIRAMLPVGAQEYLGSANVARRVMGGRSRGHRNTVSDAYKKALHYMARQGWIERGTEFVRIIDREALWADAIAGRDPDRLPAHFVFLQSAIDVIEDALADADHQVCTTAWVEQRRRELTGLMDLMRATVGGIHWSGRGSVRFVPKGRVV